MMTEERTDGNNIDTVSFSFYNPLILFLLSAFIKKQNCKKKKMYLNWTWNQQTQVPELLS